MSQDFTGQQPALIPGLMAFSTSAGPINCQPWPRWMFHATEEPRLVGSQQDADALGPEWSQTYIQRDYPKAKFGPNGEYVAVKDPEEEGKLEGSWSDTPPERKEGERYPKRADQRTLQELGEAIRDSRRLSLDYGQLNQDLDTKADNVATREISAEEIPRPQVRPTETPEERKRREAEEDERRRKQQEEKRKREEEEKKKRT